MSDFSDDDDCLVMVAERPLLGLTSLRLAPNALRWPEDAELLGEPGLGLAEAEVGSGQGDEDEAVVSRLGHAGDADEQEPVAAVLAVDEACGAMGKAGAAKELFHDAEMPGQGGDGGVVCEGFDLGGMKDGAHALESVDLGAGLQSEMREVRP